MDSPPDPLITNNSLDSPTKRKASVAGLDGTHPTRPVKRRASKACQCCRTRKVRCNVTEHGAPCTNCRLDEVDCIVSESRRKKSVSPKISPLVSCGLQFFGMVLLSFPFRTAFRGSLPLEFLIHVM